jgi:hypothetical protein
MMNDTTRVGGFLTLISGLALTVYELTVGIGHALVAVCGVVLLVGLVCLHAGLREDLRRRKDGDI